MREIFETLTKDPRNQGEKQRLEIKTADEALGKSGVVFDRKEYLRQVLRPNEAIPGGLKIVESILPREKEVLHLVGQGLSNKEIADKLIISPKTVHTHVANIFRKLDVHSKVGVIIEAVSGGIIDASAIIGDLDMGRVKYKLTDAQKKLLGIIIEEKSTNKTTIKNKLKLSEESTARRRIESCVKALGAKNNIQAVVLFMEAQRQGLVPLAENSSVDQKAPQEILDPNGKPETVVFEENSLSRREREVLSEIARGLSSQQIAKKLKISFSTVKNHNHKIYEKLGVMSRMEAVIKGIENRVIDGQKLMGDLDLFSVKYRLTDRQTAMFKYMIKEECSSEKTIADGLHATVGIIKYNTRSAVKALGVKDRMQAAVLFMEAQRQGLV